MSSSIPPEERWILYLHAFGVSAPIGIYDTGSTESLPHHCTCGPIKWTETHQGGYIGLPFDGDRTAGFYYTLNQDGQQLYDRLTRPRKTRKQPWLREIIDLWLRGVGLR